MKYKSQFKKDVLAISQMLREEFYVGEYEMAIAYMAEDQEEEGQKTAASIPMDNRYLNFKIQIYPVLQELWLKKKDELFNILVHEFSHILTEPIYMVAVEAISKREQEFLEDIRERQTQRIANIIGPFLKNKIIKKKVVKPRKKKK